MKRSLLKAARWSERLAGGLDPRAAAALGRWTNDHENADALERTLRTRALAADLAARPELRDLRDQTLSRIGARGARPSPAWSHALAAAAAVALVIGLPTALLLAPGGEQEQSARAPVWTATYTTLTGQTLAQALPDGSRITLDTASRATVTFDEGARRIELERGQALFDVAKDPSRPFVVIAGGPRIVAVGTRFTVRKLDAELRVGLIEGRVVVTDGTRRASMNPDDLLVAGTRDIRVRRDPDAVAALASWTEGRLVFHDKPLPAAVAEINRYALRPILIADDEAARIRISGSFRTGDTGPFLEALAMGFPVDVTRRSDGAAVIAHR